MPQWPDKAQQAQIFAASVMLPQTVALGKGGVMSVSLPPQGVLAASMPLEKGAW